ncbi:MAG TPA: FliM/FliN family flagellar motor C-terminal domain-containing protein [Steroidobacter sp.]
MSGAVRPIILPGAAALEWLRLRAQSALDAWAREWVVAHGSRLDGALRVEAIDCTHRTNIHEYEVVCTDAGCMWFRAGRADRLDLGCAVVGHQLMPRSTCADDWIAGVVDGARHALTRELTTALLGAPMPGKWPPHLTALPAAALATGTGSVLICCEGLGLHAVADGSVWRSVPPTRRDVSQRLPALTAVDRAIRKARARLDVMLGSTEVELPKLVDLRCGDVLRLPQRLDQSLAVLCEGQPLAQAALGQAQGRICVQIVGHRQ